MRSLMLGIGVVLGACVGGSALAQDKSSETTIQVEALGSVETPPEVAQINYVVRGEGKTADEATRAMVARKTAIEEALGNVEGPKVEIRTGDVNINEVRGSACRGEDGSDDRPHLSTGPCAVQGYLATIRVTLKITPVEQAGTLTGLAGRAGASEVELSDCDLLDEREARQRAMASAVTSGAAQAQAIAAASGGKLGRLLRVVDNSSVAGAQTIVVTGSRLRGVMGNVTRVDIAPKAVTTGARLVLTFEVLR